VILSAPLYHTPNALTRVYGYVRKTEEG